jgi:hypothetical protein
MLSASAHVPYADCTLLKSASTHHAANLREMHDAVLNGQLQVKTVESYITIKKCIEDALVNCDNDTKKVISSVPLSDQMRLVARYMSAFVHELSSLKETINILSRHTDMQQSAIRRLTPENYISPSNWEGPLELYAVSSLPSLVEFDILYRSKAWAGRPSTDSKLLIKSTESSRKYLELYQTSQTVRAHVSSLYPGVPFSEVESVQSVPKQYVDSPQILADAYTLWNQSDSLGAYHLYSDALRAAAIL